MSGREATSLERAAAVFLTRSMLGFVYLFAGVHKLVEPGAADFAQGVATLAARFPSIPSGVFSLGGALTAPLEILLGGLVLLGLWTRPTLRCLAILIVAVTIAHGIDGLLQIHSRTTAMDIRVVNLYILPRAALLMVTLFQRREDDLFSIDGLREGTLLKLSRS